MFDGFWQNFPKFWQNFDKILIVQRFEWFDRSPIESFHPGLGRRSPSSSEGATWTELLHFLRQHLTSLIRVRLTLRGGGVRRKSCLPAQILSQFSENFWKFLKYIATFGDYLEYSEIPTKIGEFFDEKLLILMKILQIFAKSRKIAEIWRKNQKI